MPFILALCCWFYERLLVAYPAEFKRDYGLAMAQLFRDEARSHLVQGKTAVFIYFLIRTAFDLIKTIFIEHIESTFNVNLEGSTMSYHDSVNSLADKPKELEHLYHQAKKAGHGNLFKQAIEDIFNSEPQNQLLSAWYHRLNYATSQAKLFVVNWQWVIPLAIFNGYWFWLLSDGTYWIQVNPGQQSATDFLPTIFLWGASISTLFILIYFNMATQKSWVKTAVFSLVPVALATFVQFIYPQSGIRPFQEQYLTISIFHLTVMAWVSVGAYLLFSHRDAKSRMQVLLKSMEIFIVLGVFFTALSIFFGITIGLFAALDIEFSDSLLRLIYGGGGGLLIIITAAIVYNPRLTPAEQELNQGFARLMTVIMQALLPLTLLVLIIYIAFIPANFRAPFDNRDVLITYNIMLFAVVGLIIGATIFRPANLSPIREKWVKRMIIGVAVLTLIVSLYALSAIIFRTINDRLTPNRLTIIGWNIVNIGFLIWVLALQFWGTPEAWVDQLYKAFSQGTAVYAIYTASIIVILPLFFGINQGQIENLPARIQDIVYTEPSPVLLKCASSPHIYLLNGGEKRWVEDIQTFNERGYVWGDVNFVSCSDLQSIPDGATIPIDAGSPPQPEG
ncbi:MAG: hypothetical protein AAF490_11510 [Chloroflexota bacterium]